MCFFISDQAAFIDLSFCHSISVSKYFGMVSDAEFRSCAFFYANRATKVHSSA